MKLFGRKRADDDAEAQAGQDTVEAPAAAPPEVDPAAWALPPDAAAAVAPETAAGGAAPPPPDPGARVAAVPPPDPGARVGDLPPPPRAFTPPADADRGDTAAEAEAAATPGADSDPRLEGESGPFGGGFPSIPGLPEDINERPELLVAGAFAGAFLFARILKRITD